MADKGICEHLVKIAIMNKIPLEGLESKQKLTIRSARTSNKKADLTVTDDEDFDQAMNVSASSHDVHENQVVRVIQNSPQTYNNPPHRPSNKIPPCIAPSPSPPHPPPTQRISSRVKKVTVTKYTK